MATLLAPPFLAGLAIHLASSRTNHGMGGVRPCDQARCSDHMASWARGDPGLVALAVGRHSLYWPRVSGHPATSTPGRVWLLRLDPLDPPRGGTAHGLWPAALLPRLAW